jgi:enediyne polyketide synthase
VIGLACRFPDADDPPTLLDTILTSRRSFRRLPPGRLDLADYYNADPANRDLAYRARAGLLEGWQFDRESFRIPVPAYLAADPAHWLALETAARALAAAGFPGGTGLDRDRIGVMIGNTLGGDVSRGNALHQRWPYVRRVLAESLFDGDVRSDRARKVLRHAAARYLAPLPRSGDDSSADAASATIPARISSYFGFRGGSQAVDGACASSLQAVASACAALTSRDIDVALAGGVDVSLDPLDLVGLAKAGALATGQVRIYDENPTGYLPGEGCGVVVLMRTAQARAAGLPVYAEIVGWGTSAGGMPGVVASDASSQLLALRRAYERAGVNPCEVQLIEGHGSGTPAGDDAELIALSELRADAREAAALGSIKANIGHAKAAAGAAGLIKTVLALGTGVIPPTTGVVRPHPLLRGSDAAFWLPEVAEEWPAGSRLAGVSAMGVGGVNVHLVLRNAPGRGSRYDRMLRVLPRLARSGSGKERVACTDRVPDQSRWPAAYLLHAPDRQQLAALATRIADVADWLSDSEMVDLACQLGRDARTQGPARIAIVASDQAELARLARESVALLPGLSDGLVTTRPGIFAADNADGRITLLLSDEADASAISAGHADVISFPEAIKRSLVTLRWLESLDVSATAAVGHGLGEIAGLAWAGVLSEGEVTEIGALRAEFLSGPAVRMLAPAGRHAGYGRDTQPSAPDTLSLLRAAITQFRFGPPRRRLISTMTGRELATSGEVIDLICGGFTGRDRLAEAVSAGAEGATLLVETGPGRLLASTAARVCRVPTVGMGSGSADGADLVWAAAGLFAAGAVGQVQPLFAGKQARPIDIWRDQVFITNPSQGGPDEQPGQPAELSPDERPARRPGHAARKGSSDQSPTRQPAHAARKGGVPAGPPQAQSAWGKPAGELPAAEPALQDVVPAPRTLNGSAANGTALSETALNNAALSNASRNIAALNGAGPNSAALSSAAPSGAALSSAALSSAALGGAGLTSAAPARPALAAAGTGDPIAGIAPWVRCFGERLRPAAAPARSGDDRLWRIRVAGSYPFPQEVDSAFGRDPVADRSLAVIGDPAAPDALSAALIAAQDAASTGRLVVITTSPGLAGFFAALHGEQPALGITILRVPPTPGGLRSARRYATAEPGEFRELVIAADGTAHEPVLDAREVPGGGEFPLGARDVALISRSSGGAALALAQVLACSGSAVAVIGRAAPEEDREVVAGLEELRLAGVRIAYEVVNAADPADMALAVQRIERRLGPVTAIAHAVGPAEPLPVADLTQQALDAHQAAARAGLRDLIGPVTAQRLRLILTFGSVAARHGLPRQGLLAVASAALAAETEAAAAEIPGCRALHIELPGWSGNGMGSRPGLAASMSEGGMAAIRVGDASRLLLKMLATPDLPSRTAVHGRVGVPGPGGTDSRGAVPQGAVPGGAVPGGAVPGGSGAGGPASDQGLAGPFRQDVRVHYPGIELVGDARLSLSTDPYLADYRVDGLPILPPVIALEALAQAASALAGQPLRRATAVTMDAPVVLPAGGGETLIRVCALADGGKITAALRCEESGMIVDHVRAEFRCDDPLAAGLPVATDPRTAPVPAAAGIVDGAELYGPIFFQSGRFRRIAVLTEITSRSCRAVARDSEDRAWFAHGPGDELGELAGGLLLGSPGLNDATLQALQACAPDRRVWPAGCDAVSFRGELADGPVEIRAVAAVRRPPPARTGIRPAPGGAAGSAVPAPAPGPDGPAAPPPPELTWDVEAVDSTGQALVTWHGVRLREGGSLPREAPWPASLLPVYLERGALALGLDPDLRLTVHDGGDAGQPAGPVPRQRSAEAALSPQALVPRQSADPDAGAAAGPLVAGGPLAGFAIEARGARFAACGWALSDPQHPVWPTGGDGLAATFSRLCSHLSEPPVASAARLQAVAACLTMAQAPAGAPVTFDRTSGDGWALLEAAGSRVACIVVTVSGMSCPVAIAIMTDPPRRDSRSGRDRRAGRGGGHRVATRS